MKVAIKKVAIKTESSKGSIKIKPKPKPESESEPEPKVEIKSAAKPKVEIKSAAKPKVEIKPGRRKGTVEKSVMGGGKTIDETYKNKELRQHIYDDPDTYAGSIYPSTEPMWIYNSKSGIMEKRKVTFIESFYKIFDEVLVNAIDQHHRIQNKNESDPSLGLRPVRRISVNIDRENGTISVENDGDGIEIALTDDGEYVPDKLFGKLLTSINYDPNEERTVGGKNGYGAKIANIFSKEFTIETVDAHRKLKYTKTYYDNMTRSDNEIIERYTKIPYTKITYKPDYKRFDIADYKSIDDWLVLERRVYDAAACTDEKCNVYLNGDRITTKTFEDYVSLYIGNKRETKRKYY